MDLNTAIKNSREIIESPFHSFIDLENNFNQKNAENNFKVDEVGLSKLKDWYFDESGNFVQKSQAILYLHNFLQHSRLL